MNTILLILLGIYIGSVLINLGLVLSFRKSRYNDIKSNGCAFALFFVITVFPGFLSWIFMAIYSYREAKKKEKEKILVLNKEDFEAFKKALEEIATSHEK